ncbi:MAG: hypothetical protein IJO06_11180, partial [Thermoguttaceae bacterium]|nr:hypothetical protein [Thermoguttaceae bacterium]
VSSFGCVVWAGFDVSSFGCVVGENGKTTAISSSRRVGEEAKLGRTIGAVGISTVCVAPQRGHFSSYQRVRAPHLSHK